MFRNTTNNDRDEILSPIKDGSGSNKDGRDKKKLLTGISEDKNIESRDRYKSALKYVREINSSSETFCSENLLVL